MVSNLISCPPKLVPSLPITASLVLTLTTFISPNAGTLRRGLYPKNSASLKTLSCFVAVLRKLLRVFKSTLYAKLCPNCATTSSNATNSADSIQSL